jgi:hypothetical protein
MSRRDFPFTPAAKVWPMAGVVIGLLVGPRVVCARSRQSVVLSLLGARPMGQQSELELTATIGHRTAGAILQTEGPERMLIACGPQALAPSRSTPGTLKAGCLAGSGAGPTHRHSLGRFLRGADRHGHCKTCTRKNRSERRLSQPVSLDRSTRTQGAFEACL